MTTDQGNDFAELTEEIMWTMEALSTYLSLRNKSSERDFETIVYMFAIFFFLHIFFSLLGIDQ